MSQDIKVTVKEREAGGSSQEAVAMEDLSLGWGGSVCCFSITTQHVKTCKPAHTQIRQRSLTISNTSLSSL